MKNKQILKFITILFINSIIFVFVFIAAFAEDEGTLPDTLFYNIIADAFDIIRYPTHTWFWDVITEFSGSGIYLLGLFINLIIYTLIIHFITNLIREMKNKKR